MGHKESQLLAAILSIKNLPEVVGPDWVRTVSLQLMLTWLCMLSHHSFAIQSLQGTKGNYSRILGHNSPSRVLRLAAKVYINSDGMCLRKHREHTAAMQVPQKKTAVLL